jgi:hypothetical protein
MFGGSNQSCHFLPFIAPYSRYNTQSTNQPYGGTGGNLNLGYVQNNVSNGYASGQVSSFNSTTSMSSPYSSSSSPGYYSPNIPKYQQNHNQPLKKYVLQPPVKRLPLSKTMPSLGYPDMFPQKPGQEEDLLSEQTMRNGFFDKSVVSVCTLFSMSLIYLDTSHP